MHNAFLKAYYKYFEAIYELKPHQYIAANTERSKFIEPIDLVDAFSNFRTAKVPELSVLSDIYVPSNNQDIIGFAQYVNYDLVYGIHNNLVVCVDETAGSIELLCAANFEKFMDALTFYFETEADYRLGSRVIDRDKLFDVCMQIASIDYASDYWRYIIGN